jgi:diacylglycerol kinase (ATP)
VRTVRAVLASLLWNPAAGGGRAPALLDAVQAELAAAGVEVQLRRTSSLADARRSAAAAAGRVDLVLAAGGDGTVGACANGLADAAGGHRRLATALGAVPTGSGNDLARAMGLPPDDPVAAARLLPALASRPVDVVRAELGGTTARFLIAAATGFDGQVNRLANRLPLRGRPRYIGATLLRLPFSRPSGFTLELDGERLETRAWMVTVANGPTYGGGLRIAPAAVMDDGLLDVVVIGGLSRTALLRALPTLFDGSHVDNPAVSVHRATRLTVRSTPAVPVYTDGEPLGSTPASFTVEPGALRVLTTDDAPGLRGLDGGCPDRPSPGTVS